VINSLVGVNKNISTEQVISYIAVRETTASITQNFCSILGSVQLRDLCPLRYRTRNFHKWRAVMM